MALIVVKLQLIKKKEKFMKYTYQIRLDKI